MDTTNITILPHALKRWRQRTGDKTKDESVRKKLFSLLKQAKEIELRKRFRVIQLLNHNCKDARYFRAGQFIFVIQDEKYLITLHRGEADRWKLKL